MKVCSEAGSGSLSVTGMGCFIVDHVLFYNELTLCQYQKGLTLAGLDGGVLIVSLPILSFGLPNYFAVGANSISFVQVIKNIKYIDWNTIRTFIIITDEA